MPFFVRILLTLLICSLCSYSFAQPRLVLQFTVDGLRGDLLNRYRENLAEDGFRYLLDNGVVYKNAHHLHANTETIVGHTSLATGATPAVHGMVGNVWFHADSGELGYNIEDPLAPILPTRETMGKGTQLDPAQKRSRSQGRSPRGILAPTFSDTLRINSGGQSKVFGIAGKDRSAVAMAGKTGTAYWYSTDTGDFQSSRYYMDEYPDWVRSWNAQRQAEKLGDTAWTLLLDKSRYVFAGQDDRPYEVDLKGYGRTFPHPFGTTDHPLFFTRVAVSPKGDRLLSDFAKTLIREEGIGQDDVTDYLSISFSGVDAVNHFFGPSSLENEDVVVQLDRTLAELLRFVDETIGLDETLIVLSADHGMAEMPEYATGKGYAAGRIFADEVLATARNVSEEAFGSEELVRDFFRPYVYLDNEAIRARGLDPNAVAETISAGLEQMDGIGSAVPTIGPESGLDPMSAAIRHNHHPQRSGAIYVYQKPYWFLFERGPIGVMHGSPWGYDSHVNVVFTGPGIQPATVNRLVHPIDVAPTLSALLGLSPPASSQGEILREVLSR